MRTGMGNRRKPPDDVLHQVDFAAEGRVRLLTVFFLTIQPGHQWTALAQQHIQTLHQTMTAHRLVFTTAVMVTQSAHAFTTHLRLRGVIPDQVTCDNSSFRMSASLRAFGCLSGVFLLNQRGHPLSKTSLPALTYFPGRPRCIAQKPRQAADATRLHHPPR